MARLEKIRLGDLLMQRNLITAEQLQSALDEQQRNGRKLGRVLADNNFVTEEQISEALASQLAIPYINLKSHNLNLEIVRRLPENQSRRFRALPLEDSGSAVMVGMADPTDTIALDELSRALKRKIDVAVVTEGQLLETIDRVYRRSEEIGGLARELSDDSGESLVGLGALSDVFGVEDAPTARLLQAILDNAMRARASDIHIEPVEGRLQVRFRIDGVLVPQQGVDAKQSLVLLTRVKQMSGMDVTEKRLPQEGYFNIRAHGQIVDVRIYIMPTQFGESVVMHLAGRGTNLLVLDKLGMDAEQLRRLREITRRSNGLVLVCGPADSGKTATLYALLADLNTPERKIVAVGEQSGYRIPGAAQVLVNDRIDMTFARALRPALQQDPDIMLVGELHDSETAAIALRAAMTDCLLFAGICTRDAADALPRLVDMGMPPYLVASAVLVVLAQYLVRRVCSQCSEPYPLSAQESEWLARHGVGNQQLGGLRRGAGCQSCNGTGYMGRFGVFEMLEINRELVELSAHGEAAHLQHAARNMLAGKTLLDQALQQAVQGNTTVTEVMRIANQLET